MDGRSALPERTSSSSGRRLSRWIPGNAPIVDLELAPRNAEGRAECSGDVRMLKPVGSGNRRLVLDVVPLGPKRVIPGDQWWFAREHDGQVVPDRTHVFHEAGFEPARTPAERPSSGDPRGSIAERYPTRADFPDRTRACAVELSGQRYLLETDIESFVAASGARYDDFMQLAGRLPA